MYMIDVHMYASKDCQQSTSFVIFLIYKHLDISKRLVVFGTAISCNIWQNPLKMLPKAIRDPINKLTTNN